jgi:hypothetical protein
VKGLIPRVGLVVVWGPPKCGKSFWTYDLSMHVALGWDYRGRRVQQGPVVYCAFEGADGFKARAEAFRRHHLPEDPGDVDFFLIADRAVLAADHEGMIRAIRTQLDTRRPAGVVLDTLNRSLGGPEDDKHMPAYVQASDAIREAFGCVVIIVHHCGVDGTRPRGHTSLTGAVDAQLAVKRDAADNVVVTVEWMKDGPEGAVIVSRLEQVDVGTDADGDKITSCVVVPGDPEARGDASKSAKLPKAAQIALRALAEALAEQGQPSQASTHVPNGVNVVPVAAWRQHAYRRGISTSDEDRAKQMAFKRASEYLVGANRVGIWDGNVWLP